jgi:hypothetical protein
MVAGEIYMKENATGTIGFLKKLKCHPVITLKYKHNVG